MKPLEDRPLVQRSVDALVNQLRCRLEAPRPGTIPGHESSLDRRSSAARRSGSGTAWAGQRLAQAAMNPAVEAAATQTAQTVRVRSPAHRPGALRRRREAWRMWVLKVLEREHVPIDVIAGTSMGAIIGGLYASGMSAAQLEAELLKVDWKRCSPAASTASCSRSAARKRTSRSPRSSRSACATASARRWAPCPAAAGDAAAPLHAAGARRAQLRPLPIPFRALATDMETGKPVVLSQGDLALALRSSMSVPGVFAPTE
jgi:NTE family protein